MIKVKSLTIEKLRKALDNQSYIRVQFDLADNKKKTQIVDISTINAIVKVYDALKTDNKENLRKNLTTTAGFLKVVSFAWKHVAFK